MICQNKGSEKLGPPKSWCAQNALSNTASKRWSQEAENPKLDLDGNRKLDTPENWVMNHTTNLEGM